MGKHPARYGVILLAAACGARTDVGAPRDAGDSREGGPTISCRGELRITADDQYRLFLNGTVIDETARKWWAVQQYAVTLVADRSNSIAIEATNMWSQDGIDRGVIVDLRYGSRHLLTDHEWRISTTRVDGWERATFDTSTWLLATVEGENGIPPYGMVLGASTAQWLWSYDSNKPVTMKPGVEVIWLRRDFVPRCP